MTPVKAQDRGGEMFQQSCAICHTIGGGRLVGPDLSGVTDRRTEDWLLSFIKSSQTMIQSGDPVASKLFSEYNNVPMPDQPYTVSQIQDILAYIRGQSGTGDAHDALADESAAPDNTFANAAVGSDSTNAIRRGQELFVGIKRFENGGSACNACHTVDMVSVVSGGTLARDLTTAYSRLTEAGLKAIIKNPPFPAMQRAVGAALTENETNDLVAFLKVADEKAAVEPGRDYARLLLLGGLGGFGALLLLAAITWSGRARREVNHNIYMRQVKSL